MADNEKNQVAARRFRQRATRHLARAVKGQEIKNDLGPSLAYLVGELHRRTGNCTAALQRLGRVPAPQLWLAALVKQQRELAAHHHADPVALPSSPSLGGEGIRGKNFWQTR